MVLDGQVRKLWKLLEKDEPLCRAALKVGMDEKTARKYRDLGRRAERSERRRTLGGLGKTRSRRCGQRCTSS